MSALGDKFEDGPSYFRSATLGCGELSPGKAATSNSFVTSNPSSVNQKKGGDCGLVFGLTTAYLTGAAMFFGECESKMSSSAGGSLLGFRCCSSTSTGLYLLRRWRSRQVDRISRDLSGLSKKQIGDVVGGQ